MNTGVHRVAPTMSYGPRNRLVFMANVAPEIRDAMVHADMELAASGIAQGALKAGDRASDFRLHDARGGYLRLKDLLARGPVVLSFYRGGWCPYCGSRKQDRDPDRSERRLHSGYRFCVI